LIFKSNFSKNLIDIWINPSLPNPHNSENCQANVKISKICKLPYTKIDHITAVSSE